MRGPRQIPVETSESLDINMSPLIDMVFLLLIFFIVGSKMADETGIPVDKPRAVSAQTLAANSLMLTVTRDGKVLFGSEELSLNRVRGLVARQLQARNLPVILVADSHCQAGILVKVLDECKLAGARDVSIAAVRDQAGGPPDPR